MKSFKNQKLVASGNKPNKDLVNFVSQGTKANQQKESFYKQLGSLIGLDLDNPIDQISLERVRNLEKNPKVVLFDVERVNGLNQRGIVTELIGTKTDHRKPNLSKKAFSQKLSKEELRNAGARI